MAGKMKHKSRSRKTAARRLYAAKYYLNYSMSSEERKLMRAMMLSRYMKNP